MDKVIGITMDKPTKVSKSKISSSETMTEFRKDFGDRIGGPFQVFNGFGH